MHRPWPDLILCGVAVGATAGLWCAPATAYLAPDIRPLTLALGLTWTLWRTWCLDRALTRYRAWTTAGDWHLTCAELTAVVLPRRHWWRHADPDALFLGQGFRWDGTHTQALETALLAEKALPVAETVRGGHPAIHAVGQAQEEAVRLPWDEAVSHTLLEGMTRAGKSELLHILLMQVIARRKGLTVIIDPKGKRDMLAYAKWAAHVANKQFVFISPAFPAQSATMNVFGTATMPAEVAMRIRALTPGDAQRKYDFFTATALTIIERVASAQQVLGIPWTLEGLYQVSSIRQRFHDLLLAYLVHLGHGQAQNITEAIRAYTKQGQADLIADALIEFWKHDERHFKEISATLIPTFAGVVGKPLGRLFSSIPSDVTWDGMAKDGVVVYIQLASLLLRETANRIGRIILQDLVGYLGHVYAYQDPTQYVPITILVDEVRHVLYEEFLTVLAMSGEAQVRWILAQQSRADPEYALGKAAAEIYYSNLGTKLTFRLGHDATAKDRAEALGTCRVEMPEDGVGLSYGGVGGLSGSSHRRRSWQKVPLLRQEWLKAIPRGEYVATIKGEVWKGRVPLLERVSETQIETLGLRTMWEELPPNEEEGDDQCDED